jgi:hypothetical protein
MSKTDKTRPWAVRAAEQPMVTCMPVHDHRWSGCTLPVAHPDAVGFRVEGCYWEASDRFTYGRGCSGCGCRMCTDFYGRRAERRRERHETRRRLRNGHIYVDGLPDLDHHHTASNGWTEA